ncbi:MAG TPA: hypothetical protein VKM55_25430 [Candidatus Lokiarchaeia archaeon]|nr:hypothetical protein [Candidatus Lokiarchaeia archaeon]
MNIDNPLLFALYSIEVFLDFELALFLLVRGRPRATRHIAILGLAYVFFGVTRIFLIFWDFEDIPHTTSSLYITGAFFAFLAMSVFMYAAEVLIARTKHVFTICFLAVAVTCLFLPFDVVRLVYYIFAPLLICFTILFLCLLMSITSGSVRKSFFVVFVGLCLYGLGYAFSAELLKPIFPAKVFPSLLILAGLAFTGMGFINIPSFQEIHWDDSLLHVFVFHIDTSVCIYDESLIKIGKDAEISADLFSSGVSGIINIIKEMVQSEKKLKVLDHEDKKIILEYGEYITVALVTVRDLKILHEKLPWYISRIEGKFGAKFEHWNGEITQFTTQIKTITKEELQTKFDGNWWKIDPKNILKEIRQFFSVKK